MATQMVRPQPAPPPRDGYQRRQVNRGPRFRKDEIAPQQVYSDQSKGPVAEYAAPDDYGVEGYSKDMASDDPYAVEQPYQAPTARPSAPGYSRYTGTNSGEMISNDRDFAFGRGDEIYQGTKDRVANETQVRANYNAYGDEVYDPLIGGRGGYNVDEARGINNAQDLDPYMTTEGDFNETYLSPEEQAAISGRPWDRAAFYNPDGSAAQQNNSAVAQRGAVDSMGRDLQGSLDGEYGLSDEYETGLEGALSGTEGSVRGAYDPANLKANEGSLDRIRMTPEEAQDMVTSAGISGGMKYRAAAGEVDRRSRAAGIDPVGAAAVRGRYMREAAATGADAMTAARVATSNARAGREATAENLRMGGERTAADLGTATELELGGRRVAATQGKENTRLSTVRDMGDRKERIATTGGQARIASEQNINAQGRQVDQFNTTTGTAIATGIEQDAATRAAAIAASRQKVKQSNQATRFQQGATRVAAASEGAQTVAAARRADAQEGRGYVRDRANVANTNTQNDLNRQASTYATQMQGTQATTGAQIAKDNRPKWWEQAIAAAAAGGGTAAKASGGGG